MKIRCYLLIFVNLFVCTACFDPTFAWRVDKEFREQGVIVIHPYPGENALNGKPGFVVRMLPEDAKRLQAPSGIEFRKLLNERVLGEERILGHKLCQFGYEIIKEHTLYYYGVYVDYDAECKEKQ